MLRIAAIRRETRMLALHRDDAAINDWIEKVYDWDDWT
jgi:hypothetical protein